MKLSKIVKFYNATQITIVTFLLSFLRFKNSTKFSFFFLFQKNFQRRSILYEKSFRSKQWNYLTFRKDRYDFRATLPHLREFHVSQITVMQSVGQRWASRRVKPAEKRRNDSKVMAKCSSNYRYAADERLRRTPRPCLLEVATTSIRISTKCPPFFRAFYIRTL